MSLSLTYIGAEKSLLLTAVETPGEAKYEKNDCVELAIVYSWRSGQWSDFMV